MRLQALFFGFGKVVRNLRCSRTSNMQSGMHLKPHDVAVVVVFCLRKPSPLTYRSIAFTTGLSSAESHASVRRALVARLLVRFESPFPPMPRPNRANIFEFLAHGVKYAFPAERGGVVRGIPTASAAPVLRDKFMPSDALPLVWPHPAGPVRGESFEPLYRHAPDAAQKNPDLYEAFALIDAIRSGGARERELAVPLLKHLIHTEQP
jgi:hypothetical protein